MSRIIMIFLTATCLFASVGELRSEKKATKSYYLIGNSLTWDTVPSLLDGDVQWHVGCGKSLPYMYANPENPCVKTSTIWPKALKEKQYDFVSVQPHYGSTLKQDVETISAWMKMQPKAVFVIHSGWARQASRADEFADAGPIEKMQHNPTYFRLLIAELRRLHPGRELRQTRAIHLLAKIAEDVTEKKSPLSDIAELHRDAIHVTLDHGRYLMHNAMRHALGQPASTAGFEKLDAKVKRYLDGVLALRSIAPSDGRLLRQVLAKGKVNRPSLIAKISDANLKGRLSSLLSKIEHASQQQSHSLQLQAEVSKVGGRLYTESTGPQWLYLATNDDTATQVFERPFAVDLYNGNNPLKGRGGRNEQVTDAWLSRLSGYSSLRKLNLANCEIHGDGLRHVGELTGLRELNLTLTPVSDDGLAHLRSLTELRKLGLASSQCTGTGFEHLTALKKLRDVNFHFTPLNDAGLRTVCKVGVSGRLWFAHTHFTDDGAKSLTALKQLRRCGIGSKESDSSGEAVASLTNLPLEDLSLLDNQATPTGVAHASRISTLRRLDVSYAPRVGDAEMKLIAQMPRLEEFKLGNAKVTDEGIQHLAESKSLKKLTLSRLKNVSKRGIERLQKARPELKVAVN